MVRCFIRIRKHRKIKSGVFIIALSVALLLGVVCTMLSAVRKQYESELDTTYESLSNSMFALRNLISFEDSLQSSYESFDLREAKIFTDVARMYFDYNGVTKTSLSDYAYRMGDCEIYFFANNGSEIASDNADRFLLDDDNLRALKTAGVLEAAGRDYTAVSLKGGWLCFQWEDTQALYSVDFERILETCPNDLCVIETATGRVVANSGAQAYDFLNESLASADSARTAYATDGIEAGFFGGVYFVKLQIIDRYTVYAHTPLRTVMSNAMRTVAPGVICATLIVMYAFDSFFAGNPISKYLFSNQRKHRPGIFSLTTILLSVGYAVIGIAMLKKLLGILSGRMDSRAKTISDLIESIVQFVVVLFMAIYSLYQVGVNTSVILTSAGVLSLIIGYGSQSIVSDLVSGLFLITEDQVRIGDCIILGDFRGIVTHIGLRTTTVELYNNLKVINNSQMVGFINLSRYTAGALLVTVQ